MLKYILLSHDAAPSVYLVPCVVADNLSEYCAEFDKWLRISPHAEVYRIGEAVRYTSEDFIKYLNTWVFPDEPSQFIENLHYVVTDSDIPEEYKHCEWFNF